MPILTNRKGCARKICHTRRPQAAVLALWSFGIVLAHRCTLPAVANLLSPLLRKSFNTVRQRLREWYKDAPDKAGPHRCELEVTTCFASLLAWALKNWPSPRVALALDATTLADRLTVLSLSLVYRGTAIPVAWKVLRGNTPQAWEPEWRALLHWFAGQVDRPWTVIVMTDRGLYAGWLFQEIVALGWHPMMRVTCLGKFRPEGWTKPQEFGRFVPRPGRAWQGAGSRSPASRSAGGLHAVGLLGRRVRGSLVHPDRPAPAGGRCGLVRPADVDRARLRAVQVDGLALAEDADHRPKMAGRMWLALALATFWVIAVGGEHDHDQGRQETMPGLPATDVRKRGPEPSPGGRLVSVLNQGIAVVLALLIEGRFPRPETWYPKPWPGIEVIIQDREHEQTSKP